MLFQFLGWALRGLAKRSLAFGWLLADLVGIVAASPSVAQAEAASQV